MPNSFLLPILPLPWITLHNVEQKGLEVAEVNITMSLSWKNYSNLKGIFGKYYYMVPAAFVLLSGNKGGFFQSQESYS